MPISIDNARKFLESLQRFDLASLLAHSTVETGIDSAWGDTVVYIRSPRPFAEAIKLLPPYDRKRIAEAVLSDQTVTPPSDIESKTLEGPAIEGPPALLAELMLHKQMMIAVAVGDQRIQDVNDYYIARQARLIAICTAAGVSYENPHLDLWAWYYVWKERFSSYAERRRYVAELFGPAIAAASSRSSSLVTEREPTGWERVDRALMKARAQLEAATAAEDFQGIGLLCREVIISLAQAVYDPAVHLSPDGVAPSATDANRMIEAYIGHVFPGESYKEVRAHARASMALALNLQHRRTATRQLAALCLEAAGSTTAVIAIISGRR